MKEPIQPGPSIDRLEEIDSAKHNKELINWIFDRYEKCSNRYIESERFITNLCNSNIIVRFLIGKRVNKFIKNQLDKYNF